METRQWRCSIWWRFWTYFAVKTFHKSCLVMLLSGLITVGQELRQQHPLHLLSSGDVPQATLSGRPGAGQQITPSRPWSIPQPQPSGECPNGIHMRATKLPIKINTAFQQGYIRAHDIQEKELYKSKYYTNTLIARFMGPTLGPSGANRTQVGPMLAPWTLLSG